METVVENVVKKCAWLCEWNAYAFKAFMPFALQASVAIALLHLYCKQFYNI